MIFKKENVSAITGELVEGPVRAWQTREVLFSKPADYITGKNPGGDLLLFSRKQLLNWQVSNISTATNTPITSSPRGGSYRYLFLFLRHFLAASDSSGDLHAFRKRTFFPWEQKNVSAQTGEQVDGAVTWWQEKKILHRKDFLGGVNSQGEVLVFKRDLLNNWSVKNITTETGKKANGPLTSWVTRNGPYLVPHLAGPNNNGELIVFWRKTSGNWGSVNVTAITGKHIDGPVTSWVTQNGPYTVEHLAGRGTAGELLVFWWSPQHDWQVVNVSRIACGKIEGMPADYRITEGGERVEMLASRGPDRRLLLHWWRPSTDWQMLNVTKAQNIYCYNDPSCWRRKDIRTGRPCEFITFESGDYQLMVFEMNRIPRDMLKSLAEPFHVLPHQPMQHMRKNLDLLTVLWNWDPPTHPIPTQDQIEELIVGATNSVNDYYRENSGGHFKVNHLGTVGWYSSDYPMDWYKIQGGPNEDFINRHHYKYLEAARNASDDFNFQSYDSSGDGKLHTSECGILLLVPGETTDGYVRSINLRENPNALLYSKNGIEFSVIAEVYLTPNSKFGVIAHELTHLLLGHGDMYLGFPTHSAAGQYSLMDQHNPGQHLDPFAKLKYGWVCPRLILRTGNYTIKDIETNHRVLILMDPNHSLKEYFIIENRSPGTSYDQYMNDQGLGIWHIMEDPQLFNTALPPKNVDPVKWNALVPGNETRLAIRMVRPILTFNDNQALWDGSDPVTGYDLLSVDNDPAHNELLWGDGTPSGFNIKNISAAGPSMTLRIEVPF